MITLGERIAWGIPDPLPLSGFPSGKTRIIQRPNSAVRVCVKSDSEIAIYAVKEDGGKWIPALLLSRNITYPTARK